MKQRRRLSRSQNEIGLLIDKVWNSDRSHSLGCLIRYDFSCYDEHFKAEI